MTAEEIIEKVIKGLPDAEVHVRDLTGTADHWELEVHSKEFLGKTPIDQHRLVYSALGTAGEADLHAVKLKTIAKAPSEDGV